jgi:ABC-type polysaccharide/polyol phosphate transport system ATPase subunit
MAVVELNRVALHLPVIGADARLLRKVLFSRYVGGRVAQENIVIVKALENVTASIEEGDRVGLIGHNGAGKTTLLRVLAGVYPPTAGTVSVRGRVSALLNPGLGMDVEDTGYENIRNMGMLLGMSKKEIDAKIDQIAEFTELGGYLALPVRTYSAGMHLRLTFAVVTAIDPDILLLDEGLGAGDARFAERAQKRVDAMIHRASVLVIASHSEEMVRKICNKAMLLDQGELVFYGPVGEAFEAYRRLDGELR